MRISLIWVITACLIMLAGCEQQATSPDSALGPATASSTIPPEAQKLLDEYVGLDRESPPAGALDALNPGQDLTGYCVFSVTILWGDIFGGSSNVTTDWSGDLSVVGQGLIRTGYEIDFEPGEDYILPAASVDRVQWVSYTTHDFDGINFIVYLSPITAGSGPSVIYFRTGQFTMLLICEELFRFSAYYQVDESLGVLVHSQVIWQNSCPGGTMVGDWIKESNNSNQGSFHGQWLDHTGEPIGYMSGQFWTNGDGTREFSGNVSGIVTDQVIAELQGAWAYDDPTLCPTCGTNHGFFYGRFHYIDGSDRRGRLSGVFGDMSAPPGTNTLPYCGFWRIYCPYILQTVPSVVVE